MNMSQRAQQAVVNLESFRDLSDTPELRKVAYSYISDLDDGTGARGSVQQQLDTISPEEKFAMMSTITAPDDTDLMALWDMAADSFLSMVESAFHLVTSGTWTNDRRSELMQ